MKEKQEKETLLSKNKKSAAGAVQETAKVSAILQIFFSIWTVSPLITYDIYTLSMYA